MFTSCGADFAKNKLLTPGKFLVSCLSSLIFSNETLFPLKMIPWTIVSNILETCYWSIVFRDLRRGKSWYINIFKIYDCIFSLQYSNIFSGWRDTNNWLCAWQVLIFIVLFTALSIFISTVISGSSDCTNIYLRLEEM